MRLRELVGEAEEEEPEGEVVAGPSDEATIHDSGIMSSLSFLLLIHAYTYIYICTYIYLYIYIYTFLFFAHLTPELLPSFLEQMSPLMRRNWGLRQKRRAI